MRKQVGGIFQLVVWAGVPVLVLTTQALINQTVRSAGPQAKQQTRAGAADPVLFPARGAAGLIPTSS